MRRGRAAAREAGVTIARGEVVEPFGEGWLIRDKRGFVPCPWAFPLARFCPVRAGDRALDLGCGNGVLLWALRQVHPDLGACVGVDLAAEPLAQGRRNARLARCDAQVALVRGDVRAAPIVPRAFDLVVSNPPFYPEGWGRESRRGAVHRATHALHGDVADFARAAAAALAPHGRVVFVYDAARLPALLMALADAGLTARRLRLLVDDRDQPSRALVLAGRDGGGLDVDWRS